MNIERMLARYLQAQGLARNGGHLPPMQASERPKIIQVA